MCDYASSLYFIFNYSLPVAIGTTITAVIITAVSGALAHIKIRNVDWSTTKTVAVSGGLGAAIGSIIFVYLAGNISTLNLILGFAFLYVSLRMIFEGLLRRGAKTKNR